MKLSDNPRLALFQLQHHAEMVVNEVNSLSKKTIEEIDHFKELEEITLVINSPLALKARYPNNDVTQTITSIKIIAAPWTNGHKDNSIDCKIKLKVLLTFANLHSANQWESSLYSLEFLPETLTMINNQNREKDLIMQSTNDFKEIEKIIKDGIIQIGLEYPIKEN